MRRLLSLAALAVFTLVLSACGGSAEFDQDEFQETVLVSPPVGLTIHLDNFPTDDIPGIESGVLDITVNTSPALLKFGLTLTGTTSITLNIIATEDASYVDVGEGWMKSPPSDDLSEMAAGFSGPIDIQEITAGAWVYKAEVPCGDETCWQVESEDGVLMNLRTDDYTPVSITVVEDGVEFVLDILHWGDAVDVELPTDAREVTSEELIFSLIGALLPLIAGGS